MQAKQALAKVKARWKALPRWARWTLIGLGVFAVLGGGGLLAGKRIKQFFWQGSAPWGSLLLGFGNSSIASAGCLLTAMTMAGNALAGSDFTPDETNEIVKAGNGFTGSELIIPTAADVLGMRAGTRTPVNSSSVGQMVGAIDQALSNNGLAIIHVAKNLVTNTGEHFIICHSKTSQGYACADPATGADTFLSPSSLTGTANWNGSSVSYKAVDVAQVFSA